MRIAIATDAWAPQVNGVVNTLRHTRDELLALGHDVLMLTPQGRRSVPCPTYPEIRLTLFQGQAIAQDLDAFAPEVIHIATEGTLGLAVRRYCLRRRLRFTTAYHTQFPEYVRARVPLPVSWTYAALRRFHRRAERVMVATPAMQRALLARGFDQVVLWSRGVQSEVFSPRDPRDYGLPRPIWINVGRVSVEKNIEQFLRLPLPGSKVIVGDGPDRERLMQAYPECHFVGYRFGAELASYLAGADVFVFPSKTDTFGLVMLEAMACGLPVAAYPVTGPVDVVTDGLTGSLRDDLALACRAALELNPDDCLAVARQRSWAHATRQFIANLAPIQHAEQQNAE